MSSPQPERAAWELEGKEQIRVGVLDWSLLKRLWTYVHPERYRLLAALALLLINQALRLLQPTLVALALDRFLVPREPTGAWAKVVGAFERWSATVDGLVPGGASPLAVLIGTFGAAAGVGTLTGMPSARACAIYENVLACGSCTKHGFRCGRAAYVSEANEEN